MCVQAEVAKATMEKIQRAVRQTAKQFGLSQAQTKKLLPSRYSQSRAWLRGSLDDGTLEAQDLQGPRTRRHD